VTLDLDKLLELNQAQFKIAITDRNGRSLSADAHLDDLQQVQEVYGSNQTWYWSQFWYDQKYPNGKLDWKIGRVSPGEYFAAFSCEFMNFTFCGSSPGNIAVSVWYNWPVSQLASRVRVNMDFGYLQLGAFEVNPSYLLTQYALDLKDPAGATGLLAPFEIGWVPTFGGGLRGSYKFGAWYNSSKAPDVVENTRGQALAIDGGVPLMRHGEYGAYFNFLQNLTRFSTGDPEKGVKVFINSIYADRRTSTLDSQVAAGVLYSAPFASRPNDEVGLAIGRTHVNSRVAEVEAQDNVAGRLGVDVQGAECVGELFYKAMATEWLTLRPNVQYVHEPGGIARNSDDLIVGLRLSINF